MCFRAEPAGRERYHHMPLQLVHLCVSAHGHVFKNRPVKIKITPCIHNDLHMFAGSCVHHLSHFLIFQIFL